MNSHPPLAAASLLALLCAAPAAFAVNVAGPTFGGAGICGVNAPATLTALGTPRANAGTTANINDGNVATGVDTFGAAAPNSISYVGIRWPFLRADSVKTLTFTMNCFGDGGWFGLSGQPNPVATAGTQLTSTLLIEPTVQITTDGGVTWSAVDATTSYLNQVGPAPGGGVDGHTIGGGPVTFTVTLDTPVSGINGIRLIGENGGWIAGDPNGFLGIRELAVDAGPVVDTDNDGMEDSWETTHGLIVGVDDSLGDAEVPPDGLPNIAEFLANTDPRDPDTDNDGLNDGPEVLTHSTNPHVPDSDGDGLSDGAEVNTHGTNPAIADTDGDGLSDGAEINTHSTSPTNTDSDGDQFPDGLEVTRGFSPSSNTSRPQNIAMAAAGGSGLMGLATAISGGLEVIYSQQGTTAAILNRIVDENTGIVSGAAVAAATRIDTFINDTTTPNPSPRHGNYSFAGVTWATARALPIARVEVTLTCFADGGWWGLTNNRPAATPDVRILQAGNLPTAADMPVVQVTTTTVPAWTTIPATTNYDTAEGVIGHPIGGGPIPSPSGRTISFNITDPAGTASNVTGIRVIGREGGTAGASTISDSRGFFGVSEVVVKDTFSADDLDGDGVANADEILAGSSINLPDTDFDGLSDQLEIVTLTTNPANHDSDGDGFPDRVEQSLNTNPKVATSRPANIARAGIGTSGINNALDADSGTHVAGAQTPAAPAPLYPTFFTPSTNVNDGSLTSRVDTFNASVAFSYAGVRWPHAWPQPVSRVELRMATFFDGGWFGDNSEGPGNGGTLTEAYFDNATAGGPPTIQVTTDGLNWSTTLPGGGTITSDYLAKMIGHVIGNTGGTNPTTAPKCVFTIDPPITAGSIKGLRVIGREGGTASGGFVGIFDLTIQDTTTSNDLDGDGLTNADEVNLHGTDPENADTDGDGLPDGLEVNTYASNPLHPDSDGDQFRDGLEHQFGAHPAQATSFPDNVALLGTAIMGVHGVIDGNPGTPQFQAGVLANINDGNEATRVDTWNTAGGINSYAGILWAVPQTIKTLRMNFATFVDGGWFGDTLAGNPAAGGPLTPAQLLEPTVQISTDGGLTWTTVSHTSDYLTVMNGHLIGGGSVPNPSSRTAVFTLDTAAVVTGVRLIGPEGGTASNGFLGCFELGVGQSPVPGDADNDGLPDAWEISKFGYVHAQHLRMDTDGDGSDNLLECGLGMDPIIEDQPPAGQLEGGYLTMTITKVPGIAYSVLSGSDTTGWSSADTTVLVDNATTLKVRDNTPIATGPRRFLKTDVSPAPLILAE